MAFSKARPGAYAACLVSLGWAACGSPQEVGGAGADCYRILDCAEGFACVRNQCSKNLGAIEGETPEMPEGDAAVSVPADAGDGAAAPAEASGNGGAPPSGDAGAGGAPQGTGGAAAVGDAAPG